MFNGCYIHLYGYLLLKLGFCHSPCRPQSPLENAFEDEICFLSASCHVSIGIIDIIHKWHYPEIRLECCDEPELTDHRLFLWIWRMIGRIEMQRTIVPEVTLELITHLPPQWSIRIIVKDPTLLDCSGPIGLNGRFCRCFQVMETRIVT